MNFFQSNGKFDRKVRRFTSLLLAVLMIFSGFLFIQGSTENYVYEAAEYKEPMVRVALTLEEEGYTSYAMSCPGGYSFGYINCNTDEFVALGSSSRSSFRADLDNKYYIELKSLKVGDAVKDLRDPNTVMLLDVLLSGYGMPLIPSYHDGFCYRMGPFDSNEEAAVMMEAFMLDIEVQNSINAESGADQYILDIGVFDCDGSSVAFSAQGGETLFCFSTSNQSLALAVKPLDEEAFTTSGSYYYPGIFEFRRIVSSGEDALITVNVLPLETYVPGVASREIFSTWPLETHKIFAVIVRTFTVRSGQRHGDIYSDVCYKSDCQAYRGYNRVNDTILQAAQETEGLVLTYNSKLAQVYYSAVAGGSTVSCDEGWYSAVIPYLSAKPTPWERYKDYDKYTSEAEWHVEYTGKELYNKLKSNHSALKGAIADVKINRFCTNSCYVYEMTFTDVYGNTSTVKRSDTIRRQLGLNSANFVVGVNGQTVQRPEYSLDCFPSIYSDGYSGYGEDYLPISSLQAILGNQTAISVPPSGNSVLFSNGAQTLNLSDYNLKVLKSSGHIMVNRAGLPDILNAEIVCKMESVTLSGADGKFIFEGRGWGHGIGFSQYGIWDLCLLGYDFETVLQYHLSGSEVVHLQELGY
ncbi:MAG: SpoIID/LytB domain-containing protein [Clostridia bacterium]|nr:SpoIID/LytB domain-containing protein [Clostridia bacterium]